jgi:GT2 family glycosyltransferase
MKLSIVIICWNDLRVIGDCLRSIYQGTHATDFEVIVSDNGSTDGSVEFIRQQFPQVRVIENRANLRFSKGNNVGIRASQGDYVLILNPDTIIHDWALDKWMDFADRHPEAGAFGCRVVGADGSYQESARPFPTIRRDLIAALYLRPLARLSKVFTSDHYWAWKGDTERRVDWQCGCSVLFRGDLLRSLGGFDEQFFYYYEDVDLCRRVWQAGYPIIYTPDVTITHLGGQSTTKRFPLSFELDKQITRYRYYHKYYGRSGARQCRLVLLTWYSVRRLVYGILQMIKPTEFRKHRLDLYRAAIAWNMQVDPVRLVEKHEEPTISVDMTARVLER